MSRHVHRIDGNTVLVAGYDHMNYYFVQKFVGNGEEPVYSIATDPMSTLTPHPDYLSDKLWTRQELAKLIEDEGGPREWSEAMILDNPF